MNLRRWFSQMGGYDVSRTGEELNGKLIMDQELRVADELSQDSILKQHPNLSNSEILRTS